MKKQTLPKDLLEHLEKGDRTNEQLKNIFFFTDKGTHAPSDLNQLFAMQQQISQMPQIIDNKIWFSGTGQQIIH